MAIFQPSNVIPSSFAGIGLGTIDVNDNVFISWQVNGNSPLMAFSFKIYDNSLPSAAAIYESGVITVEIPTGGFYGVDNKGNPQQFSYSINTSWKEWSNDQLTNGKEYKLEITQYWGQVNEGNYPYFVTQYSGSVFLTRTTPTLALYVGSDEITDSTTIDTGGVNFTARLTQEEGDIISSIRWEFADSNGKIIDDTGFINTGVTEYYCKGLFSGNSYKIKCTIITQSNDEVSTDWINFSVDYTVITNSNELSVECTNDRAVLLQWGNALNIPATKTPQDANLQINNGVLTLENDQSLSWNTVDSTGMNFSAPFSLQTKLKPFNVDILSRENYSNSYGLVLSPDKRFLVSYASQVIEIFYLDSEGTRLAQTTISVDVDFNSLRKGAAFSYDGKFFILPTAYGIYMSKITYDSINEEINFSWEGRLNGTTTEDWAHFYNYVVASPANGIFVVNPGYVFKIENDNARYLGKLRLLYVHKSQQNQFVFTNDGQYLFGADDGGVYRYTVNEDSEPFGWVTDSVNQNRNTPKRQLLIANTRGWLFVISNINPILIYSVSKLTQIVKETVESEYALGDAVLSPDETTLLLPLLYGKGLANISVDDDGLFTIGYILGVRSAQVFNNDIVYINTTTNNKYGKVSKLSNCLSNLKINNVPILRSIPIYNWIGTNRFNNDFQNILINSNGNVEVGDVSFVIDNIESISSISINGLITVDYIYLTSELIDEMSNETPYWNNNTLFFANFTNGETNGGTYSAVGATKNSLYRKNQNGELKFIADITTGITTFKDYGLVNNEKVSYLIYFANDSSNYSTPIQSKTVCMKFDSYMLIEARQDIEDPNAYHVVKQWRFGNNLSVGSISNNNSPNWLTNFTPYRLKQPSSRFGKSGTLQALLSNYNTSRNFYEDTVEMMERLYQASQSNNTFFLKDIKGNLYMVGISAPIVQTIEIKSKVMQVKVSIPWEEVGDARRVSIIQTPTDEEWQTDQVGEVKLNVNTTTGVLSATYPNEYEGTTFELDNANLIAKTPAGIEPESLSLTDGAVVVTESDIDE